MRTLHISVLDKKATYLSRDGDIVCGNSDYVIEFAFDAEWDAYEEKTARFIWNGRYQDVTFTGTSCPVPIITNAVAVKIGVYAGELSTTTSAVIGCQKSILCENANESGGFVFDKLPHVTIEDDGKMLIVKDGAWVLAYPENASSGYTAISITSFGHNAGIKEYGETVTDVVFSWKLSKAAKTLMLDGDSLDVSATSKTLSGLSVTKDSSVTWTLVATDERNTKSTKTTAVMFANGVYYGVAAEPAEYDSAFILGLNKELSYGKVSNITVNAGEGEYIYYCLPSRMGECTFTIGIFPGGFELVKTIDFTNEHGYTEQYRVYRSDYDYLGQSTVNIS